MTKSPAAFASSTALATVTLETPIERGEDKVAFVQLRKPKSGELRGLSMVDIVKLEVDTLHTLLPRITNPPLTEIEIAGLSAADLFQMSTEVAGFFLPAGMRPDSLAQ